MSSMVTLSPIIRAFLFKNPDGSENISNIKPEWDPDEYEWVCYVENVAGWEENYLTRLPQGTIRKIIGRDLSWIDEPIQII